MLGVGWDRSRISKSTDIVRSFKRYQKGNSATNAAASHLLQRVSTPSLADLPLTKVASSTARAQDASNVNASNVRTARAKNAVHPRPIQEKEGSSKKQYTQL